MIIRHPTLPVIKDVSDAAVSQWEAVGWLADRPAEKSSMATPEAENKPARRRKPRAK